MPLTENALLLPLEHWPTVTVTRYVTPNATPLSWAKCAELRQLWVFDLEINIC